MKKKRPQAPGRVREGDTVARGGPEITVNGSGDAVAASGSTAVTGYRGPAPEADRLPRAPLRLSDTGDATATHGGLANAGYMDIGTLNVVQRAFQEPAPWPHQVGVIPLRARSFQHRGGDGRAAPGTGGGTAVLSQVLTGMGGVGKTQLAADHARTAWERGGLDVLVWVSAGTRDAVVAGYAQAGVELCRADPGDPERAARSFLAWLTPKAGAKPCRWLIVLDDVTDPADLRDLWPPGSGHGRTLVTTRRRDAALAGDGRHLVQVGLFSMREALTYLTTSLAAHGRTEPADQLTALVCDLGHLPLALAQAAAYLVDSGDTAATYRELLADRTTALADTAPDALPDDQALPLAAVWSLSVDRADTLRPVGLARPMLHLTAMMDANGIPHDVLTGPPALAHLTAHRITRPTTTGEPEPVSARDAVSVRDAVHALRALHRLSLIDHTPETPHQAVRVHQLVQRATRDTLTPAEFHRTARTAGDALIAAWPANERDTALAQTLRANAGALTGRAEDDLHRPNAHQVLFRTGISLGATGQLTEARDHFQHLTETTRHHPGPDHPDTLAARGHLASWRGEAGDAAGAADAFVELLADRVRVLGEDHPSTLITRNNLVIWQMEAAASRVGGGAVDAFAELVEHMVRALGEDHPETLTARGNLISQRGEAGDAVGAAGAFARLVEHMVRVLGEDHPSTLTTRENLASWRGKAGDAGGAATAFAGLVEDMVRVLGEDHPDTLGARGHLASWRGKAGDAGGAATAFAGLLEHTVRVLGEGHPFTLQTRFDLAFWQSKEGNMAGLLAGITELLERMPRVLGEDHPHLREIRENLARWPGKAEEDKPQR